MRNIVSTRVRFASTYSRGGSILSSEDRLATTQSRTEQTMHLPDKRVLGFAEYGCPQGTPLMFFHGYPSSRLEAAGIDDIARQRRIRIISPDRPGFGLSTYQPERRIVDWPADVRSLAQHLELPRFSILGGSGGGPYALACAHMLPKDMMSAVGLMAPAPPWEAGTKDVKFSSWLAHLAVTYWPSGFKSMADLFMWTLRKAVVSGPGVRAIDQWVETVQKDIGTQSTGQTKEEMREELIRFGFEAFAQGNAAAVQETKLLTHGWGFSFEDVAYDRILIWHGTRDRNSPLSMVRYMADRLPHCTLTEFDTSTHFNLVKHLDTIIDDLVPQEAAKR